MGTFAGMTASKDFDLRKIVRGAGGSYHVVKNKLAAKASEGSKIEKALQGLKGVSAVAYTSGDPVVLAKALSDWVKDNSEFTFKLGIVDGQLMDVKQIGELATMPGKEVLFAKLLFLIQSPAQTACDGDECATGRDLAVVINQGVEKGKFTDGGSAAPAAVAEAPVGEAPATEAPSESPIAAAPVEAATKAGAVSDALEAPEAEPEIAAAHAEEAPTPTEQIAENPASEADPIATGEPAQPENGTASQAGEAANTEPVEG